jgi:PAS domain S-box-containing protein
MSEDRFSCFLTRTPMPIAVLDSQFRFLEVNEWIAQFDGKSAEVHLGKTVGEVLPDLEHIINPILGKVLATNEAVQIEIAGGPQPPEKTARHWLLSCVPVIERSEVVMAAVEITERKRAEEALEQASVALASRVIELEQVAALAEMVRLLHAAINVNEAYRTIERFMPRLFASGSGALCMIRAGTNVVELAAAWGDGAVCESVFASDDCRALREGRFYRVNDSQPGVDCTHAVGGPEADRLCVP